MPFNGLVITGGMMTGGVVEAESPPPLPPPHPVREKMRKEKRMK
jgi:hypothetical protein